MLAPVNRLPPEIISHIGRCILDDDAINTRSIVPLTHVCRYWRDSIISTPDNWTLVSNQRLEDLAALSLERSKAAPLTIRLHLNKLEWTKHPRFHKLLLSHIQDIMSLSVFGSYTVGELTRALPNFPKSMPNLRSLTLLNNGLPGSTQPIIDPFDFSVHALRSLSLRDIPLYPSFLSIRTLTEFTLFDYNFNLHLDVLLNFLEENHSLESANLKVEFVKPSLCHSHHQIPIGDRLRYLSISVICYGPMDDPALNFSLTLRRSAVLEIDYHNTEDGGLDDLLSGVSTTHLKLPDLSFPTSVEYRPSKRSVRLLGPDWSFTLRGSIHLRNVFGESPRFPPNNIREFRLGRRAPPLPTEIDLSSFPSLEVLVISDSTDVSRALSTLLPSPKSSPMPKTLAFLNCIITEDFMDELAQFASDRDNTTSTPLHRVVVVDSYGELPDEASIERLRKRVPVVEVMEGCVLPTDL